MTSATFAFLLAAAMTPPVRCIARAIGAVDVPDGGRHRHARPTPRLGGLGLFFAVTAALLLWEKVTPVAACLLSGGALTVALGMTDDAFSLRPWEKLLGMGAVSLLPAAFGLFPRAVLTGQGALPLPPLVGILFSAFLSLLLMNAWNLADGADGLVSVVTLTTLAGLSLAGRPHVGALGGAAAGFLFYNAPPASVFLGDSGALFLGYAVSVLLLSEPVFSPLILLLAAYPLLDLLLAVLRRLGRGQSPFAADGEHLHHRLRRAGLSPGEMLLIVGAVSLVLSLLGGGILANM